MQSQQTAALSTIWRPLPIISEVFSRSVQRFRDGRDRARYDEVVARLPPHLRLDIGAIDHRPPSPPPLAETLKSHQNSLETMWLRYL